MNISHPQRQEMRRKMCKGMWEKKKCDNTCDFSKIPFVKVCNCNLDFVIWPQTAVETFCQTKHTHTPSMRSSHQQTPVYFLKFNHRDMEDFFLTFSFFISANDRAQPILNCKVHKVHFKRSFTNGDHSLIWFHRTSVTASRAFRQFLCHELQMVMTFAHIYALV